MLYNKDCFDCSEAKIMLSNVKRGIILLNKIFSKLSIDERFFIVTYAVNNMICYCVAKTVTDYYK